MTDIQEPVPAVAVSPTDQSFDRAQSDTDQAGNLERNLDDRAQSDEDHAETTRALCDLRDELASTRAVPPDQSSDRAQADENQRVAVGERAANRQQSDEDQIINTAKLDELILATAALGEVAGSIGDSTANELAEARLQRGRFMKTMIAVAITTVLVLSGLLAIDITSIGARGELQDCVTPSGKCFQQGQARTGKAVQWITQVAILAAVCAPDYVRLPIAAREKAIEGCILARLPKGI